MPENDLNPFGHRSADQLAADIWEQIIAVGQLAGLDTTKFGDDHRDIVDRVAAFLTADMPEPEQSLEEKKDGSIWGSFWWNKDEPESIDSVLSPIVICGVPGTGKTTFLYVLDRVLRSKIGLPDMINPEMQNFHGRTYQVPKRMFCGGSVSLLSVRKWSELHRFYAWDITNHKFVRPRLEDFIDRTLAPMRIVFADEVEPSGYSPTLPDMTARNLLVIGTSNQYDFPQLELEANPPVIFRFEGPDLRSGDPADAVIWPYEEVWDLFDKLHSMPEHLAERLPYQTLMEEEALAILINFREAVQAPMVETEWYQFLNEIWDRLSGAPGSLVPESKFTLLMDRFSLDELRTDYNAIIRFVWLFDAIEQLGIGVLVRNGDDPAELSREAFDHMKVTIHTSRNVTEEVRQRTLVGIDRVVSRIGQAGVRARKIYDLD